MIGSCTSPVLSDNPQGQVLDLGDGPVRDTTKEALGHTCHPSAHDNGPAVLLFGLTDDASCLFKVRTWGQDMNLLLRDACLKEELTGTVEETIVTTEVAIAPFFVPMCIEVLRVTRGDAPEEGLAMKEADPEITAVLEDVAEVIHGHQRGWGTIKRDHDIGPQNLAIEDPEGGVTAVAKKTLRYRSQEYFTEFAQATSPYHKSIHEFLFGRLLDCSGYIGAGEMHGSLDTFPGDAGVEEDLLGLYQVVGGSILFTSLETLRGGEE